MKMEKIMPRTSGKKMSNAKTDSRMSDEAVAHLYKHIGNAIRTLRRQKGMTQKDIAVHLNLNHQVSVGYLENGKKNVSLRALIVLARVFKVTFKDLIPEEYHALIGVTPAPVDELTTDEVREFLAESRLRKAQKKQD